MSILFPFGFQTKNNSVNMPKRRAFLKLLFLGTTVFAVDRLMKKNPFEGLAYRLGGATQKTSLLRKYGLTLSEKSDEVVVSNASGETVLIFEKS